MELHVQLAGTQIDPDVIQGVLLDVDPVAVVDVDRSGELLRVSAEITAAGLVGLMHQSGYPVTAAQVLEVPPFCCGSCGG